MIDRVTMRERAVMAAAAVWALVLCTALAVCTSCGAVPPDARGRAWQMQWESARAFREARRAVGVGRHCDDSNRNGGGSGVLVGPTTVITAAHVINCAPVPEGQVLAEELGGAARVEVYAPDGTVVVGHVVVAMLERDLARLELAAPLPVIDPPELGPAPEEGSTVCVLPANPSWTRTCGSVTAVDNGTGYDLRHSADTIPGNSGSGVYDEDGRLVAIATRCGTKDCKPPNGGSASTLWGSGVMP